MPTIRWRTDLTQKIGAALGSIATNNQRDDALEKDAYGNLLVATTSPGAHVEASTTAAAASQSPALPAAAGKTTYITGFAVTGGGATAASVIRITVDGTATQLNFDLAVPAGVTLGVTPLIVCFPNPIPASAVNSAVTLNVPSFGAGNTIAAAAVFGFQV